MRLTIAAIAALLLSGCARATLFERYVSQQEWSNAAREFAADSSLRNNEHALYQAGVLFGTPGLPIYDPVKSRELLSVLLTRFPGTGHRADATGRVLLLDEVFRSQRTATARERELEGRIATLTRETRDLRSRIDSMSVQNDSLRSTFARLDTDRRDKEDQLKALRLELQRLKEIDLKPRPPSRPIP